MAVSVGQTSITVTDDDLVFYLDPAVSYNYTLSEVEVLVVAGGGGGGGWGGGGGGGGVIYNQKYPVTPGSSVSVTIGNGGSPGTNAYTSGGDGGNSVFGVLTAIGGGGGGHYNNNNGRPGGSGGGGGGAEVNTYGLVSQGGAGTPGQGFPGGRGGGRPGNGNYYPGGGGGGAGEKGYDFDVFLGLGGKGGDGLPFNISGRLKYYGGGGGGHTDGGFSNDGNSMGGKGGGGRGGTYRNVARRGLNGAPNTGGGGGGAYGTTSGYECGTGGSGVVIVRYPGPQKAQGGNVIEQIGGYTIHTFTSGGSFTPNTAPTNGGGLNGLMDLGPNRYNFYQVGTPTYSTSRSGTVDFNGTSAYLEYILPDRFNGAGIYSINMWFKINGAPSGASGNQANFLIDLDVTGGSFNGLLVDWQPYLSGSSQMRLAYSSRPSSGGSYTSLLGSVLTQGVWYNACLVRNGTTDAKLYLNGNLDATYVGNIPAFGTTTARIARWTDGTVFSNMSLGPVWVQNSILTAAEVSQNFNALRGRFGV